MSESENNGVNEVVDGKGGFRRRRLIDEIALFVLLGLGYLGVAITNISPPKSQWYWLAMVPIFFIVSLITEWHHVRSARYRAGEMIWTHALQWLALAAAIEAVFIIQQLGRLNNETTGLMLLLVTALSVFDAGIRMGWLYRLTGIFLGVSLLMLAYIERYLWIMVLIGVLFIVIYHFIARDDSHQRTKPNR